MAVGGRSAALPGSSGLSEPKAGSKKMPVTTARQGSATGAGRRSGPAAAKPSSGKTVQRRAFSSSGLPKGTTPAKHNKLRQATMEKLQRAAVKTLERAAVEKFRPRPAPTTGPPRSSRGVGLDEALAKDLDKACTPRGRKAVRAARLAESEVAGSQPKVANPETRRPARNQKKTAAEKAAARAFHPAEFPYEEGKTSAQTGAPHSGQKGRQVRSIRGAIRRQSVGTSVPLASCHAHL